MAQIQEQQPKFDPTTHHFSPEELKPTPIQKKSRKQLVRDEDKDEKYWDKVWLYFNPKTINRKIDHLENKRIGESGRPFRSKRAGV